MPKNAIGLLVTNATAVPIAISKNRLEICNALDLGVERAPLALDVQWLPAIENRGEGIFLQFGKDAVEAWMISPALSPTARWIPK
ncbi:MAG TPA: hypothetical protein VKV28_04495 [Candidatus Binataceae bacterium]|nr:hypothetical protein [Candidatus Binataceae bacterium]